MVYLPVNAASIDNQHSGEWTIYIIISLAVPAKRAKERRIMTALELPDNSLIIPQRPDESSGHLCSCLNIQIFMALIM